MLTQQQLHSSVVLILGAPGTGKTTLAEQLALNNPDYKIIHTDDFIVYGYEESLYELLNFIHSLPPDTKMIIEGVLCYRLLRKGAELGTFYPDQVIEVTAPKEQILEVYASRGKDPLKLASMQKGNDTVLQKYYAIRNEHLPKWSYYDNNISKDN